MSGTKPRKRINRRVGRVGCSCSFEENRHQHSREDGVVRFGSKFHVYTYIYMYIREMRDLRLYACHRCAWSRGEYIHQVILGRSNDSGIHCQSSQRASDRWPLKIHLVFVPGHARCRLNDLQQTIRDFAVNTTHEEAGPFSPIDTIDK